MPCSLMTPNASTIFCDDCGKGPCSQIAPNGALPRTIPNNVRVHYNEPDNKLSASTEYGRMRRQRVDVNTRNLADLDEAPKVRRIDWTHEGRDWLINHLTWALKTGKSVTLSPAEV